MKFYVYILYSPSCDKFLVGCYSAVDSEHAGIKNEMINDFFNKNEQMIIVYLERFDNYSEAIMKKTAINNFGSRHWIENNMQLYGNRHNILCR
jgi:predicted GIY-YIG superfamily endonuclease